MNSQYSSEIQNAYASQAHQRALNEAASHRTLRDLDSRPAPSRVGISARAKVFIVLAGAVLISLASSLALAAGEVISSGGGKFLVY